MRKLLYMLAVIAAVPLYAGVAGAQYGQGQYGQGQYGQPAQHPLLDDVSNRVIEKYQNSSCEQLWQQRGQPKTQKEQEAIQFLHNDPKMRRAFIDRVAAPIANKLFECGMIA